MEKAMGEGWSCGLGRGDMSRRRMIFILFLETMIPNGQIVKWTTGSVPDPRLSPLRLMELRRA